MKTFRVWTLFFCYCILQNCLGTIASETTSSSSSASPTHSETSTPFSTTTETENPSSTIASTTTTDPSSASNTSTSTSITTTDPSSASNTTTSTSTTTETSTFASSINPSDDIDDELYVIIMSVGCVVLGGLNIGSFIFCILQLRKRNALKKRPMKSSNMIELKKNERKDRKENEYANDYDDSSIDEPDKERKARVTKPALKARTQVRSDKSEYEVNKYEEIKYEEREVDTGNRSDKSQFKRNVVQRESDRSKSSSATSSSNSSNSENNYDDEDEDEDEYGNIRL